MRFRDVVLSVILLAEKYGCFTLIVFMLSCSCVSSSRVMGWSWVGLQSVIVAFPGHTHLFLFLDKLCFTDLLFQLRSVPLLHYNTFVSVQSVLIP